MNPQDIIIIAAFALVNVLICMVVIIRLRQLNRRLDDQCNFIYVQMKEDEEIKDTQLTISNDINELSKSFDTQKETMTSLTSSIRSLVKQNQAKNDEKIFPGPQLLQLIDSCITETILMTATLISKQRVPNDPLVMVTEIVTKTFPHVDVTFLEQRIIYIMEEYNKSSTGQKAQ